MTKLVLLICFITVITIIRADNFTYPSNIISPSTAHTLDRFGHASAIGGVNGNLLIISTFTDNALRSTDTFNYVPDHGLLSQSITHTLDNDDDAGLLPGNNGASTVYIYQQVSRSSNSNSNSINKDKGVKWVLGNYCLYIYLSMM